jgi:RNA polymerase sigma-70 factor, ECF subfamily
MTTARPEGFDVAVVAAMRRLKLLAMKFTRNSDAADDLVSETVLRAIENSHQFREGTNLNAWLSIIMRNAFFSRHRRKRREVEDPDGIMASLASVEEGQTWACDWHTFERFARLMPAPMRDAFNAIVVDQLAYDEAAVELGVPVGTVKSRVNRAKEFLEGFTADVVVVDEGEDLDEEGAPANSDSDAVIELYKGGASVGEIREKFPHLSRMEVMEVVSAVKRS